jgi:hypothetical protein
LAKQREVTRAGCKPVRNALNLNLELKESATAAIRTPTVPDKIHPHS